MTKPITIAKKNSFFSHRPGVWVPLPKTKRALQIFPTLVHLYDLSASKPKLMSSKELNVLGPVGQFTVELNCESSSGSFWGRGREGFFRFFFDAKGEIQTQKMTEFQVKERLFLGSNKKPEVEAISKRLDMREVFPLWFALGSLVPALEPLQSGEGMFSLLKECRQILEDKKPGRICQAFKILFKAGFSGLLLPRLTDPDHQGVLPRGHLVPDVTPFYLLFEGARIIRSLFIEQKNNYLAILPSLPPEFSCGKMTGLICDSIGSVDIEWTKKKIRRVTLRAGEDTSVHWHFQTGVRHFRVRESIDEVGASKAVTDLLEIKSGSTYLLDRFEK